MKPINLKQLVLLFLLVLVSSITNAQVQSIQTFGTVNEDTRPFSSQAVDKNIVTVWASKAAGQKSKLVIRKTDASGNEIWRNHFTDNVTTNLPDLTPAAIICDNMLGHQGEIYVLANANYNTQAVSNDVYFFKLDLNGNLISSRRLMADLMQLGLPGNSTTKLVAYSMIQLKLGTEKGDFLIAANLAADNQNGYPVPGIAPKVTQIVFKVRPNMSINWGRQVCFSTGIAGQSFPVNSRNATYQLLEKADGNIMMSGWRAVSTKASKHLLTEISVNSTGLTILNDNIFSNSVSSYDFAGHSMTQNLSTGELYTSYYGEAGSLNKFMVNAFSTNGSVFNRSSYVQLGSSNNPAGPYAKLLYDNPNSVLFVTSYSDNTQNFTVLGSLDPTNWSVNWAKTFPQINSTADSFALTYEISILDNGSILLTGDFKGANGRDIVSIITTNGPQMGDCEQSITFDDIIERGKTSNSPVPRRVDQFENPQWRTPATFAVNVQSSTLCGCPTPEKSEVNLSFCQVPGVTGKWYQPCSGAKQYILSGVGNNYSYNSATGYWANGVHITGCIAHYLTPGKYTVNYFNGWGCIVEQVIVTVTAEMPDDLGTTHKNLYFCATPGTTGRWVNPCDEYRNLFGPNSLPSQFRYTSTDLHVPPRGPMFNSYDWKTQHGGDGCISLFMETGTYEVAFYDEADCSFKTILFHIIPTSPDEGVTATVNKTYCPLPGVTGKWINPCSIYQEVFGSLPASFMYTSLGLQVPSPGPMFNSDDWVSQNGGDGCIALFMEDGDTEIEFFDKNNCSFRRIVVNISPLPLGLTDTRSITKEFCSLTSSGKWVNPCSIYEELYGPGSLPANFVYTSMDNQVPPRGPMFNSDDWKAQNGGDGCIALFMEEGSYTINFFDKDNCTYVNITVNIVDRLTTIGHLNPINAHICPEDLQAKVNICDLYKYNFAIPFGTLPPDFSYTLTDVSFAPTMPPITSEQLALMNGGNLCPDIFLNEGIYNLDFFDKTNCVHHIMSINVIRLSNCDELPGGGNRTEYTRIEVAAGHNELSQNQSKRTLGTQTVNQTNDIILFPNPGSGIFKIKYGAVSKGDATFEAVIVDVNGKQIATYTGLSLNTEHSIDISDFADGVYVVKVIQGDTIQYFKYIKN